MDAPVTAEAEAFVRSLVDEWLAPHPGECLCCYLDRSVAAFGCGGDLRFAQRYRDLVAPRATALERRLWASGGYCDCEVFANVVQPAQHLWASPPRRVPFSALALDDPLDEDETDEDADWYDDRFDEEPELEPPLVMPPCTGVRRGSTKPCRNWQELWRPRGPYR